MGRATSRTLATAAAIAWATVVGSCAPSRSRTGRVPLPSVAPGRESPGSTEPAGVVGRVVEAHNAERARHGLPPLSVAPALGAAADGQARDMAGRGRMSHGGGDGSSPFDRIKRAGYSYQAAGENVAYGFDDVEAVMAGWMRSPGHRRNILGRFTEIGVGRATAKDGSAYWCVTFGTPRGR